MKRFLMFLLAFLIMPFCAASAEDTAYEDYLSSYDLSVFKDELDSDTYELLDELGISNFNWENITSLSLNSIIEVLKNLVLNKLSSPAKGMGEILIFVLLSALFRALKIAENESFSSVYSTCAAIIIGVALSYEMGASISACALSIKLAGSFIFAFIPVFLAIVAASGGITESFSTNSMLLILSQGLSFIASNIFMPLINCFLALGICSGLRSELNLENLIGTLRKGITTLISVLCAGFVSILSIKTAVSARADALGIRSVRFVINSVVPVIGGSISEGLLSIQSYSSMIKSSVGIVGIIAISLVFLPSIIEITLWRAVLSFCSLLSEVFDDSSVLSMLKAFKDTALLINVVLILSLVTSVISFGLIIAARSA